MAVLERVGVMSNIWISTNNTERFWKHVNKTDDCWLWTGAIGTGRRYGSMYIGTKGSRQYYGVSHRFSYILHKGEIPNGLHVMHKCDVPLCVNPNHLTLGTHADNMRDMKMKGRARNVHSSNINWEMVEQIRAQAKQGIKQYVIAERFGISKSAVCNIIRGRTWVPLPQKEAA